MCMKKTMEMLEKELLEANKREETNKNIIEIYKEEIEDLEKELAIIDDVQDENFKLKQIIAYLEGKLSVYEKNDCGCVDGCCDCCGE